MNKCWCPLPWISLNLRNNGDLRLCAHSNQGHDNGLIRKQDGSTYNAGSDDISQSRNSELLKTVRQDMLAGRWNAACKRCQVESDAGLLSRNAMETKMWDEVFGYQDALHTTNADGSIDTETVPLVYYDIRFGNKCNLKCRSCGPTESNFWYEDHTALWNTNKYKESFGTVTLSRDDKGRLEPNTSQYVWYESPDFWKHIDQNSYNIQHVHMVGGEPTLIDQQYEFLQRCIKLGISTNIIIEYNSNVAKLPPKAWELWSEFKEVRIGASVDGIGAVNDYIRHPSKWYMIEENLQRFDTDYSINFCVWVATTVMSYNIWYLPDILDWFIRKRFRRIAWTEWSPLLTLHPLYRPQWLCVQSLPLAIKEKIARHFDMRCIELLELVRQTYPENDHRRDILERGVPQHLSQYKDFMMKADIPNQMEKFWMYTDKLDELRGESIATSLPEFYDLIASTRTC
jgi:organic radical activating enzyme